MKVNGLSYLGTAGAVWKSPSRSSTTEVTGIREGRG